MKFSASVSVQQTESDCDQPIATDAEVTPVRRRVEKADTAFRTIGEAAEELSLKTHVLRFWETKFAELTPMKRKDGRRFYRPEDMLVLRVLQSLLHDQGMTIKGAQRALKNRKPHDIANDICGAPEANAETSMAGKSVRDLQDAVKTAVSSGAFRELGQLSAETAAPKESLGRLLGDLENLKGRLDKVRKVV
ncbi:MAG: MerR family transcriptional regulator [Hirschia sp.]|nr:MerR family transcriptional regulator [Hirschia sp.]MBF19909.1 MerR family transcriptional regulator [Hirschia sp.]|tara:strand:- start:163 stop:738 length:576 start_codon:yes stop_codon:yes gene_type:complete